MLDNFRHPHFIGIGGSGISALAYLAKVHGLKVTGSDLSKNPTIAQLEKEGIKVFIGHQKEHISDLVELVVYSEAIDKKKNPEYLEAKRRGIELMSYFEMLGRFSQQKKTIVVTGTHGKTTTTAMLGQALIEAGVDPTVIVGSRVPAFGNRNIHIGHSEWLVAEACEYRRSFLHFKPYGMILLNCELEHVDYFKSEEDYRTAFEELAAKLPKDGFLIYNEGDENCRRVNETHQGKSIGVSLPVGMQDFASPLAPRIAGNFNQLNAAHALAAAKQIVDNEAKILEGLANFRGTARRMETKGEKNGILVMDDYGHHPTEVMSTLEALKEKYSDKRLICVFQPHQYSRTHELLEGFKKAFEKADILLIPNIFEARDTDEDKARISAEKLVKVIGENHPNVQWTENFPKTIDTLKEVAKQGDLIVTMGAGNVYKVGEEFLRQ